MEIVIYHANCQDGFGAAYAAWKTFGDGAHYVPAHYGQLPPYDKMNDTTDVYILDFSYKLLELEKIRDRAKSVIVIDHHKTAWEDLEHWSGKTVFDMNHSGAFLAWQHFYGPSPIPRLIQYIEDRDLWRFDLPLSRQVSAYIKSVPLDFLHWRDMEYLVHHDFDRVTDKGSSILDYQNRLVGEMTRHEHRIVLLAGHMVPVVNATVLFSEVGHELLGITGYECVAYYFDRNDGKRQWGLRSSGDFDCSEIARHYGGGGHKHAAGFVTDNDFGTSRL
jgi:oligoribonuclease NrnB/cAMP/cGMP phosphodiesterase (DHH superfamily)